MSTWWDTTSTCSKNISKSRIFNEEIVGSCSNIVVITPWKRRFVRSQRNWWEKWGSKSHKGGVTSLFVVWWFSRNFSPWKLDGSFTTHTHPTKLKNSLRNFSQVLFFISGGISGGEETTLNSRGVLKLEATNSQPQRSTSQFSKEWTPVEDVTTPNRYHGYHFRLYCVCGGVCKPKRERHGVRGSSLFRELTPNAQSSKPPHCLLRLPRN